MFCGLLTTLGACSFFNKQKFEFNIIGLDENNILNQEIFSFEFNTEINQARTSYHVELEDLNSEKLKIYQSWADDKTLTVEILEELGKNELYKIKISGEGYGQNEQQYLINKVYYVFWQETNSYPSALIKANHKNQFATKTSDEISFNLSKALDKVSLEKNILISPYAEVEFNWKDDKTFSIKAKADWANHKFYRITFSKEIIDCDGLRLQEDINYHFYVEEVFPDFFVKNTTIVNFTEEQIIHQPFTNRITDNSEIIALEFSNKIDLKDFSRNIEIQPICNFEYWVDDCFLYFKLIEDALAKDYKLTIREGLKDCYEQKLLENYIIDFSNGEEFLIIDKIVIHDELAGAEYELNEIDKNTIYTIEVNQDLEDLSIVNLQINFSEHFNFPESNNAIKQIQFQKVFPSYLSFTPILVFYTWNPNNNILNLKYEINDLDYLESYLVSIKVSKQITSSSQKHLEEDLEINLKLIINRS